MKQVGVVCRQAVFGCLLAGYHPVVLRAGKYVYWGSCCCCLLQWSVEEYSRRTYDSHCLRAHCVAFKLVGQVGRQIQAQLLLCTVYSHAWLQSVCLHFSVYAAETRDTLVCVFPELFIRLLHRLVCVAAFGASWRINCTALYTQRKSVAKHASCVLILTSNPIHDVIFFYITTEKPLQLRIFSSVTNPFLPNGLFVESIR